MKSNLASKYINLNDINIRLIAYIRLRINCGEYTERSLARILGISQPHLHNMLKGARRLSPEFANGVMTKFEITILDLITVEEIWDYFDEKDPEWLASAANRKPPGKSEVRDAWRGSKSGS